MLDDKKMEVASKLMRGGLLKIGEVCEVVGVSRSTLYRHLHADGTPRSSPLRKKVGAPEVGTSRSARTAEEESPKGLARV